MQTTLADADNSWVWQQHIIYVPPNAKQINRFCQTIYAKYTSLELRVGAAAVEDEWRQQMAANLVLLLLNAERSLHVCCVRNACCHLNIYIHCAYEQSREGVCCNTRTMNNVLQNSFERLVYIASVCGCVSVCELERACGICLSAKRLKTLFCRLVGIDGV